MSNDMIFITENKVDMKKKKEKTGFCSNEKCLSNGTIFMAHDNFHETL